MGSQSHSYSLAHYSEVYIFVCVCLYICVCVCVYLCGLLLTCVRGSCPLVVCACVYNGKILEFCFISDIFPFCSYSHAIRMLVCLSCTESQCHIHCWSQVGNTIESINLTSSDRFSPLKIIGECFIPNLTWHSLESSRELAQFSICLPASQQTTPQTSSIHFR